MTENVPRHVGWFWVEVGMGSIDFDECLEFFGFDDVRNVFVKMLLTCEHLWGWRVSRWQVSEVVTSMFLCSYDWCEKQLQTMSRKIVSLLLSLLLLITSSMVFHKEMTLMEEVKMWCRVYNNICTSLEDERRMVRYYYYYSIHRQMLMTDVSDIGVFIDRHWWQLRTMFNLNYVIDVLP